MPVQCDSIVEKCYKTKVGRASCAHAADFFLKSAYL